MSTGPKNHYKYCPRCATKGVFNHNEMSFKCNACGFHFFLNSAAAVTALIFNTNGELLMTHRGIEPNYGQLDLPGGFVDPGENAETAILREIKEELDLVPDNITYYGSFANEYHFSGTVVNTVDMVFKCQVSNLSNIKFLDDIMGIEFIQPNKINIDEIPFKSVKKVIKQLQDE